MSRSRLACSETYVDTDRAELIPRSAKADWICERAWACDSTMPVASVASRIISPAEASRVVEERRARARPIAYLEVAVVFARVGAAIDT